jgi:hypothetical protein
VRHFYRRPVGERITIEGEQAVFAKSVEDSGDSPLTPALSQQGRGRGVVPLSCGRGARGEGA